MRGTLCLLAGPRSGLPRWRNRHADDHHPEIAWPDVAKAMAAAGSGEDGLAPPAGGLPAVHPHEPFALEKLVDLFASLVEVLADAASWRECGVMDIDGELQAAREEPT